MLLTMYLTSFSVSSVRISSPTQFPSVIQESCRYFAFVHAIKQVVKKKVGIERDRERERENRDKQKKCLRSKFTL